MRGPLFSPLSSLFCCFQPLCCFVVLSQRRDMLCCLSVFNICLTLTTFSPYLHLLLCWLSSPHLSYLCSCIPSVSKPELYSHPFSPTLSVCATLAAMSTPFIFSPSPFPLLFCSDRPQRDCTFSPSAAADLWSWPVEKWTLQNNFHNPPAKLTKINVSGWLAELSLADWSHRSQMLWVHVQHSLMQAFIQL